MHTYIYSKQQPGIGMYVKLIFCYWSKTTKNMGWFFIRKPQVLFEQMLIRSCTDKRLFLDYY